MPEQINAVFSRARGGNALRLALAFCLPALLYLQTVRFGFTLFDDDAIVLKNTEFLGDLRNAPKAFLHDAFLLGSGGTPTASTSTSPNIAGIFYRPLQTLSFMADACVSGAGNPRMYHLTNTLLLGAIGCLLFLFFAAFGIGPNLSLLGALLFCAHPLFVSSVAWIPARGDLLLLVFSLASFLLLARYLRTGRRASLALHWVCFTAALFCKETAVMLPVVFIVYYALISPVRLSGRVTLGVLALYGVSIAAWFTLRSIAVGGAQQHDDVGFIALLPNLRIIPEALAGFILPLDIGPVPHFSVTATLLGLGVIGVVVAATVVAKGGGRAQKLFGLSWFLLLLLPTLVYRNQYYDYLNHRFFLPLVGVMLFLHAAVPRRWLELPPARAIAALIVATVALGSATAAGLRAYASPLAFYDSAVAHSPENALMRNNRGNVKLQSRDYAGAIEDFRSAVKLDPQLAIAYYNCGNAYAQSGDLRNAIGQYDQDLALNPRDGDAYLNRGNAYDQLGERRLALQDYDRAVELKANDPLAYNGRGIAHAELGHYAEAVADFDRAIALNPRLAEAYVNRGQANRARHNLAEAARDFRTYRELTGQK